MHLELMLITLTDPIIKCVGMVQSKITVKVWSFTFIMFCDIKIVKIYLKARFKTDVYKIFFKI